METKQMAFLKATVVYAQSGNLNLTSEQLSCLYKECIMMAEYLRDFPIQVTASLSLAETNMELSKFDNAIELLNEGLSLSKQIEYVTAEIHAHDKLGNCFYVLGQYEKAIEHSEMYLNIAKEIGDKTMEKRAYTNLGICYRALGQHNKAISQHEISLNIAKQTGDKAGEGLACGGLAYCYDSLEKYDKALRYYEMSLKIGKQIGDKASEHKSCCGLGNCYNSFGQYRKAIEHYEIGLNIAKQIGDKEGEGAAHNCIGDCYFLLEQYDKAMEHYNMALNTVKQTGNNKVEVSASCGVGRIHFVLKQHKKAIKHYEMGLWTAKQIGDKAREGILYFSLGNCYHSLGQYDKAIKHYKESLNTAKQIGRKVGEGRSYGNLGSCYYSLKQYKKAELNFKESLQCFEELYENTPKQDEMKISIRETYCQSYKALIQVLVLQERTNEALFTAERGRARALAELMFSNIFVNCTEITKDSVLDLNGIHAIVGSMRSTVLFLSLIHDCIYTWTIQKNRCTKFEKICIVASPQSKGRLPNDVVIPVSKMLNKLICKLRKSRSTVKCEDRSLAFLYPEVDSGQNEEELTSRVMPPMAYSNSKASSLLHFDEKMEPAGAVMTSSALKTNYRNIFEEDEEGAEDNVLKCLYQIIIDPVRHLVEGAQLVVVPEGPLYLIPFSALMDEHGHYVAESLQVRLVPSLTTAKMIVENQLEPDPQGKPLIVGDPDAGPASRLPCANTEARMIAALFNTKPLTGKEATKERFLHSIENANLIHIAAHGSMERGEILLAPNSSNTNNRTKTKKEDKMLVMSDLENKRLKARLVVLSCCHSAQGQVKAEGVVGIARSFLGAGARSVLVALWAINDKATLYFMKEFYKHLARGETAGESLNKAMAAMRAHAPYRNPQHWAPFVLIGDDVTIC